MLHNDRDGAVDFEQGIEYYNALRRLKKPVTMITYRGENHGLAKRENMRDYSIRMMEFFDYYLKGKPAPGPGGARASTGWIWRSILSRGFWSSTSSRRRMWGMSPFFLFHRGACTRPAWSFMALPDWPLTRGDGKATASVMISFLIFF